MCTLICLFPPSLGWAAAFPVPPITAPPAPPDPPTAGVKACPEAPSPRVCPPPPIPEGGPQPANTPRLLLGAAPSSLTGCFLPEGLRTPRWAPRGSSCPGPSSPAAPSAPDPLGQKAGDAPALPPDTEDVAGDSDPSAPAAGTERGARRAERTAARQRKREAKKEEAAEFREKCQATGDSLRQQCCNGRQQQQCSSSFIDPSSRSHNHPE